ncbi:MAG: hypothetical protein ACFLMY_12885 [Candidatus Brachytrichaceae bacterium NZ_4S206]
MELLVVIAVIALLAALLLPALGRAKERAWTVACLSNLKQLAACWQLYATDHDDHLPPNNSVYNIQNHQALITGGSWCTNLAPCDADPSSISSGHLFPTTRTSASTAARRIVRRCLIAPPASPPAFRACVVTT